MHTGQSTRCDCWLQAMVHKFWVLQSKWQKRIWYTMNKAGATAILHSIPIRTQSPHTSQIFHTRFWLCAACSRGCEYAKVAFPCKECAYRMSNTAMHVTVCMSGLHRKDVAADWPEADGWWRWETPYAHWQKLVEAAKLRCLPAGQAFCCKTVLQNLQLANAKAGLAATSKLRCTCTWITCYVTER